MKSDIVDITSTILIVILVCLTLFSNLDASYVYIAMSLWQLIFYRNSVLQIVLYILLFLLSAVLILFSDLGYKYEINLIVLACLVSLVIIFIFNRMRPKKTGR
jgi:hypothetical protein